MYWLVHSLNKLATPQNRWFRVLIKQLRRRYLDADALFINLVSDHDGILFLNLCHQICIKTHHKRAPLALLLPPSCLKADCPLTGAHENDPRGFLQAYKWGPGGGRRPLPLHAAHETKSGGASVFVTEQENASWWKSEKGKQPGVINNLGGKGNVREEMSHLSCFSSPETGRYSLAVTPPSAAARTPLCLWTRRIRIPRHRETDSKRARVSPGVLVFLTLVGFRFQPLSAGRRATIARLSGTDGERAGSQINDRVDGEGLRLLWLCQKAGLSAPKVTFEQRLGNTDSGLWSWCLAEAFPKSLHSPTFNVNKPLPAPHCTCIIDFKEMFLFFFSIRFKAEWYFSTWDLWAEN